MVGRLAARWRAVARLDTFGTSVHAYEVSCRVRVGGVTRPVVPEDSRLHPEDPVVLGPEVVPPPLSCGSRTDPRAVTGFGEPPAGPGGVPDRQH
ncbi:hypothetical protein GCM10027194_12640 [Thalassiella azotivora]